MPSPETPSEPAHPSPAKNSPRSDRLLVTALTAATVGLLTAGWVVSGVLVADETPPLTVATGRAAGSGLVLLAVAVSSRSRRAIMIGLLARRATLIKLAFLGYFLYFVGTMLGVARIGASNTGMVVALLPCVTFIVGVIAFSERATARKAVGSLVAVAGAVGYAQAMSQGISVSLRDLLIGAGWALLATVTFAIYNYSYRSTLHDLPPLAVLPVIFAVATLMLIPAAVAAEPVSTVSVRQWLGSLLLGAALTAPVYVTAHELVLRRGPLYMALVSLLVPFLVRISEWALGNAPAMDTIALLTMAVCLTGIFITVKKPDTKPQETRAATHHSQREDP